MSNSPSSSSEGEPSLPQALLAALDGVDEARCRRAFAWVSVLGVASPESVTPVLPTLAARLFDRSVGIDRRIALGAAVASLPAPWTGTLLERLDGDDEADRAVAASALAAPRHLEAVPALVRALRSSSARTRIAAAGALAAVGDASVVGAVSNLLDDDDARVRKAGVVALRALDGGRRLASTFLHMSADDDVDVRCAALAALLVVGGASACAAARNALDDAAAAVRALGVVILGRHGSARDAARLDRLVADSDGRVRRAVREVRAAALA